MVQVANFCNQEIAAVMMENWAACVKHVVDKVEPSFWEQNHLMKETIGEFVIHTGPESDDEGDELKDEDSNTVYVIVNVWACTRYGKYPSGIMIAPEGRSPSGTIIIPEGYFS